MDEMKRDGLENVHAERVLVPKWVRGAESADIVEPAHHSLVMLGLGDSVGTPPEGIQAEVLTIHGFDELGPEAGEFPWNGREFAERARATRREVRNLLQDQRFLAGIGNAYADEILWEARLHPKRRVVTLSEEEMARFYHALKDVIARGVLQVEEHLPPELGTKIRDHMKVRGHKGKPCPRCGTPNIKTRHGLDDMYLCPKCQPPPKGQIR